MKSYKILYNTNVSERSNKNFKTYLMDNRIEYINGKDSRSIAIEYDPERLKDFFEKEYFYERLSRNEIEQTIITDQKFAFLIWNMHKLNLKFINCKFNNGDEKDALFNEEGKISKELLEDLILDPKIFFKDVTFFDFESNRIILTKNGVIHFEKYNNNIQRIIDIINLGKKALINEKNI